MTRYKTKMVIVMRTDLQMTKGKMIAQGSHAVLALANEIKDSGIQEQQELLNTWYNESFAKVCVRVDSQTALEEIHDAALENGIPVKLITDNGWTMFKGQPTDTCIALFGRSEDLDKLTGCLKLL